MKRLSTIDIRRSLIRTCSVIGLPLLVAAGCSGEGGSFVESISSQVAEGGIGGSGVTSGSITAFGSIFVNGVEFECDTATVLVDGQETREHDLELGMVVRIEGFIDPDGVSGTAYRVEHASNVRGPVSGIDSPARTLVVLGQRVVVNELTVFDGFENLEQLDRGTVVEVSGFADGTGVIHATRVDAMRLVRRSNSEPQTASEFQVTGAIKHLDEARQQFHIGGLVVNYGSAPFFDLAGQTLADGLRVRVNGVVESFEYVLSAQSISAEEEGLTGRMGDVAQIAGLITDLRSAERFDVAGYPVTTTDRTDYRYGSRSDLSQGIRLEVEGRLDHDGAVTADRIVFGDGTSERGTAGELRVRASLDAVDEATGTVSVLGITFQVDTSTQFDDIRDQLLRFGIHDLRAGDHVEIRGFNGTSMGGFQAERLDRLPGDDGDTPSLKGPVQTSDESLGVLTVLGVEVMVDSATQVVDPTGQPLASSELFAIATGGELRIQVSGAPTGAGIHAEHVQLVE